MAADVFREKSDALDDEDDESAFLQAALQLEAASAAQATMGLAVGATLAAFAHDGDEELGGFVTETVESTVVEDKVDRRPSSSAIATGAGEKGPCAFSASAATASESKMSCLDSPRAFLPNDCPAGAARVQVTGHAVNMEKTPASVFSLRLEEVLRCKESLRRKVEPPLSLGVGVIISGPPCRLDEAAARCRLDIHGTEVMFPFAAGPLEPQRQVMEKVLEALDGRKHGVLESPTGTGKTVAVLCAALAWQRSRRLKDGQAPQLIFASRTHAQLRQAISELRLVPYKPTSIVIGSRESGLCIFAPVASRANPESDVQSGVRQACRKARKDGSCCFYAGLQSVGLVEGIATRLFGLESSSCTAATQAMDIEALAGLGAEMTACPYYMAHAASKFVDIIFCPYSYVLDQNVRRCVGFSSIDLSGRVVVIDEAHNVEGVCRDAGSTELGVEQLRAVMGSLKQILVVSSEASGEGGLENTTSVADAAPKPSATIRLPSARVSAGFKPGRVKGDDELGGFLPPRLNERGFDEADRLGIDPSKTKSPSDGARWGQQTPRVVRNNLGSIRSLIALFGRLCDALTETMTGGRVFAPHLDSHQRVPAFLRQLGLASEPLLRPVVGPGAVGTRGEALLRDLAGRGGGAVLEMAADLFAKLGNAVARPDLYAVHIDPVNRRLISLWLLAAEGTLAAVAEQLHSLLLMSGTMSPLQTTTFELGSTFGRRCLAPLQAGHVVAQRSLKLFTVSCAKGTKLECTFHAWKREPFLMAIGFAILAVAQATPGGLLVFLPSYELLGRCSDAWRRTGRHPGSTVTSAGATRRGRGRGQSARKRYRGAVERLPDAVDMDGDTDAVLTDMGESIWDQLLSVKRTIVIEPPPLSGPHAVLGGSEDYAEAKRRYEDSVRNLGSALLFAVYRGRMSEGVSFDDAFARGVICVGIPFANVKEERLGQKRAFNDFLARHVGEGIRTSGDAWYEAQALQAVAQALGRCIRHPRDYGALVLLDSRWTELGKATSLPKWLQPFLHDCADVTDAAARVRQHFSILESNSGTITDDTTLGSAAKNDGFGTEVSSSILATSAPAQTTSAGTTGCKFGLSGGMVAASPAFGKIFARRTGAQPCIELE